MSAPSESGKGANCKSFSEEEFGKRMDRCLTDVLMKACGGFVVGTVVSVLFLRRRAWPIVLGGGFGTGMAYRNCEKELNSN